MEIGALGLNIDRPILAASKYVKTTTLRGSEVRIEDNLIIVEKEGNEVVLNLLDNKYHNAEMAISLTQENEYIIRLCYGLKYINLGRYYSFIQASLLAGKIMQTIQRIREDNE